MSCNMTAVTHAKILGMMDTRMINVNNAGKMGITRLAILRLRKSMAMKEDWGKGAGS